jgi:ferredoxin-type protein NapG
LPEDDFDRRAFFRRGFRSLVRTVAKSVDAIRPDGIAQDLVDAASKTDAYQALLANRKAQGNDRPHLRLRPPGALTEASFLKYCTPCDACFDACPVSALIPVPDSQDDAGTPEILPSSIACSLCNELSCIEACDTGALQALESKRDVDIGIAAFDIEICLAYQNQYCDACVSVCPTQPRSIALLNGRPSLVPDLCTGCGLCEQFCPTWPKAVRIQNEAREAYHVTQANQAPAAPMPETPRSTDSKPSQTATPPARKNRKVEPALEDFDEFKEPPSTIPRPLAAGLLWAGPLFCLVGLMGWARILMAAPIAPQMEFRFSALAVDFLLLMLFILPHSIFARGIGRKWLNAPLGPCGDRPLYVLISGCCLSIMATYWQTTGPVLWDLGGLPALFARFVQGTGLALATWAAIVVGGSNLLGLPHLHALATGRKEPGQEFVALPPYSLVRQPLNLGILLALLGMPEVTMDRFMLGALTATWILLVTPYEERDAEMVFGEGYNVYRDRTPRWFPKRHKPEE